MATIRNRKSNPLSMEEMIKTCTRGIRAHECQGGIVLISDNQVQDGSRWWVDLRPLIGDRSIKPASRNPNHDHRTPDPYMQFLVSLNEISNQVNFGKLGLRYRIICG